MSSSRAETRPSSSREPQLCDISSYPSTALCVTILSPMDDGASIPSSPTYVSAQQSPADINTPRPFLTPPSSRGSNSASSLASAPAVQTQVRRATPETPHPTVLQGHANEEGMPPITRQQGRLNAAQPAMAQTTDSSSPPFRARSISPITRENILRDASPHSASYASQLQAAVDHVIKSLTQRGRTADVHAVQELYNQSFKDPGSRVLLDALLRNRLNDRQNRDFKRYVQDVNLLGHNSKDIAVRAKSTETSVFGKRKRYETIETAQAEQEGEDDGDDRDDRGMVLGPNTDKKAVDVVVHGARSRAHDGQLRDSDKQQGSQTVQPPNRSAVAEQTANKKRKTRRGRKEDYSERNLARQQSAQGTLLHVAAEEAWPKADRSTLNSRPAKISAAAAGQRETGVRHFPGLPGYQRRQKKKRNKMFHGANGPVYSPNILGLPA